MAKTLRDLGHPNRQYLKQWLLDKVPNFKSSCRIGKSLVQLSKDKKRQAVIELCAREKTATSIAKNYGVDRASLYNWKKKMPN